MSASNPGIARKWVFPIIRILIFAAIAAALIKLAFVGGIAASSDAATATGQVTDPEVAITTGTIHNDVVLDATVSADPAVPVRATLAGEVRKVLVSGGQAVAVGTPILQIRAEVPNADGSTSVKTATVVSGAAGILSDLPVLVGQLVSIGDAVGQVAPPTFSVTGSLAPAQQYRLLNKPTDAQVAITGGPAAFTCTGLSITTPLAGAGSGSSSGAGTGSSGSDGSSAGSTGATGSSTTVRCAVPAEVTVFAGLAAKMTISGGIAENVLVAPITAVEGSAGTGVVYVADPKGGTPTTRKVTLGISDGKQVQLTGGVVEGDMILEFVPGAVVDQATKNGFGG
jgi:multidrug efflux pump subunit AcrA (membrane-fusion protein)